MAKRGLTQSYPWQFFDILIIIFVLAVFVPSLRTFFPSLFRPALVPYESLSSLFNPIYLIPVFSFYLLILALTYWLFFRRYNLSLSVVRGRLPSPPVTLLCVATGIVAVVLFVSVYRFSFNLLPRDLLDLVSVLRVYLDGVRYLPAYALNVFRRTLLRWKSYPLLCVEDVIPGAVLAPIGEELFYRGVLQNFLKGKTKAAVAIILSSVIFGIFHLEYGVFSINGFLNAFLGGLFVGYLYHRTGSLTLVMILHSINNLLISLFGF